MLPKIVAHRGFSAMYPESTRLAFEAGLKLPIHGVECDVRLTRDGRLVVFHDGLVNRTTDGMGRVSTMDFCDLRELNCGTKECPQQVMLLEELLELLQDYPDKHLHIETKHPTRYGPEVDEATFRALAYAGMLDSEQVAIISFSHKAVRYFTRMAPDLLTYYLFRLREAKWNPKSVMLSSPYGIGPGLAHVQRRPELIGKYGCPTYVWTVNDPRDMRWCAEHGIDTIATDHPQLALQTYAGLL